MPLRYSHIVIVLAAFVAGGAAYRVVTKTVPKEMVSRASPQKPGVNPYYDVRRGVFAATKPVENPVVMLGDSIIEQGLWSELTGCRNIVNRGIGSDTTAGVLNRIDEIIALKPRRVYLMIGVNDAIKGFDLDRSAENIRATISVLSAAGIETVRFATTPVTGKFSEANHRIAEINRIVGTGVDVGINISDLSFDGVHLRASGYMKIINRLKCD